MARPSAIEVKGLAELQRELSQADGEWPSALRAVNKAVAEAVVEDAQAELRSSGHPVLRHVARLGGTSMKAAAIGPRSAVKLSAKAKKNRPVLGAELGSKRFPQFPAYKAPAWRDGLPTGGYGVHAAIREQIDKYRGSYAEAVDRLYRHAFPD